jgi:8-oxo-dGTP pyrophosphatase MutT (NUDIX family)
MTGVAPLRPAGTVILLRETPGTGLELLMIRRGEQLAFGGGAWAFPGGRVEEDDHVVARAVCPDLEGDAAEDAAARVAAIRETIEEVGIVPGLAMPPSDPMIGSIRQRLKDGVPFSALLAEKVRWIDPAGLIPFARWIPPGNIARRFDTRFFVARVPQDVVPHVDGEECTSALWATPAEMLDQRAEGRIAMMFPTRCNVARLAPFKTYPDVMAHLREHPVGIVQPFVTDRDGVPHRCVPEGHGYPALFEPAAQD